MANLSAWKMVCTVFVLYAATVNASPAQVFTKLVDFDGTNGGSPYLMSPVQGRDGSVYGTTLGTVFGIGPGGNLTTLYVFCSQPNCTDGTFADAGLVLSTDGNFYGTTQLSGSSKNCSDGCGTVFKITQKGTLTTLHSFDNNDGAFPEAVLVQGARGNLYGTTHLGGGAGCGGSGCGTVFEITPTGTLTTLYYFCSQLNCTDGDGPLAGLVQATDGNFYGTTVGAGINGGGTIFKITPGGGLTTLYSFCSQTNCTDGAQPWAKLVLAVDGNFYGTTSLGGTEGYGTVFKITPGGLLTTLYSFCSQINCTDGQTPEAGLVQANDGNFYGTTVHGGANNQGTVFQITRQGILTSLHSFDSTDGSLPTGGLAQSTNGTFYGTTNRGGADPSYGTAFNLNIGLGAFVTFVRAAGRVGQTGGILGQGFTGTTSVLLNGTPVAFTVVSDTYIRGTVPAGATTGYVTVTTPSGTLTSNVPFHVIR